MLTSGRSSASSLPTVAEVARDLGYGVRDARVVKDAQFAAELRTAGVELFLNIHSLYLICVDVLEAPMIGCFNLHPGPLPEYAGLNTVSWALYHGESEYGVTLHWMVPRIDEGATAYAKRFPIAERDTAATLMSKCVREGLGLFDELLRQAASDPDGVPKREQDLGKRRYFGRQVPQNGRLYWDKPARAVVDFVRACDYGPFPSPWGRPRTASRLCHDLEILKADRTGRQAGSPAGTVGEAANGGVMVACADEWVLIRRVGVGGAAVDAAQALPTGERLGEADDSQ